MKRITKSSIDLVLARASIEAVVGDFVRLQRTGSALKGLCPFHSERTPSFNVSPDKGVYYCFGCQKGGNAVSFLMELEKYSFREAIEHLADKFSVTLEYDGSEDVHDSENAAAKNRDALFELYERISKTFTWFLCEHESGHFAVEYLKSRSVDRAVCEQFKLGYAPADRSWLHGFLKKKGYTDDFLAVSGLFSKNYERSALFSDRLIFPIQDIRGRVIAFGARLLKGDGPKYLNSPETPIFSKQATLFGLSQAVKSIREMKQALVCEGYMDVIAFHRSGITNAVAPLGTAFTSGQAALIKRFSPEVVFGFDADEAGIKASERALIVSEHEGLVTRVLRLEGAKDAAEIMEKEGSEELKKYMNSTITADDFIIGRAVSLHDVSKADGRRQAAEHFFPYIDAIESDVRRDAFIDIAAKSLRADASSLKADYARYHSGSYRPSEAKSGKQVPGLKASLDLLILTAVAIHDYQFAFVRSVLASDDLEDDNARDIFFALEECYRHEESGLDAVLARLSNAAISGFILDKEARSEYTLNIDRFVQDGCVRLKARSLERRRVHVLMAMDSFDASRDGDAGSLNDLLYEKMYLDTELARLKDASNE